MQRLEVSGVVRPIYGSLGVKRLTLPGNVHTHAHHQTGRPLHFSVQIL